jgi:hypothetical protein
MIKKTIGTLFLLLVGTFVFAQTKQYLFDFELGIAQSAVYDDGYSLAKYKGTGLNLRFGGERERANRITAMTNTLVWTPLSTQVSNKDYASAAQQGNYRFSYTYLHKLARFQDRKIKLAVGGAAFTDVNFRAYTALFNNTLSFDGNIGLSLTGRAQHDFTFKNRRFSISYQAGLPVLAYNLRPNYLSIYPLEALFDGKPDYASLGRMTTLGSKYFYLNQLFTLDKITPNGNRIRLAYNWNYANNGFASHRYQNIISGFSFGILTNFSKTSQSISK